MDDSFGQFWAAYPRRQKRKDARKAWGELRPDATLIERILAALMWQRQQASWRKDCGQFVPLAGSWIRGERWEDEPCQVCAPPPNARHNADPYGQQAKTQEMKRLMADGMTREDAERKVWK